MGSLKDVVDLITQLNERVQDRKFSAELRVIQRMINAFQSEHTSLNDKCHELMLDNFKLQQTIASLQEEIVELKAPKVPPQESLSEEPIKIIKLLSTSNMAAAEYISYRTSIPLVKTEYWLKKLEDQDMVGSIFSIGCPIIYFLKDVGREYLVENDLI